jgi:hypothetical protein
MSKKTIAELLVETIAKAGVRNIYGVSGDSLNGITDSIRTNSDLKWIHVRHEEAAAFAAGAEAHLTGRLAVCAGSCGPGNLHLINGLYDCHRSRVPVLAIAAQIPSSEIFLVDDWDRLPLPAVLPQTRHHRPDRYTRRTVGSPHETRLWSNRRHAHDASSIITAAGPTSKGLAPEDID